MDLWYDIDIDIFLGYEGDEMDSAKHFLDRCTALAVMGGTFDPIHNGHLAIAEGVLQQFDVQKVLLVPAGAPPHKPDKPITPGEHRYQMVIQSICHIPGLEVTTMELEREGKSFTIDTMEKIKSICPKGSKIYFVIGQDALANILHWKEAEALLKLCEFIAVQRPGHDTAAFQAQIQHLTKNYGAVIHILKTPPLDISSTKLRQDLGQGMASPTFMPQAAIDYAQTHGLYCEIPYDLSQKHFEWVKAQLKKRLSPYRYQHTLGVAQEAEKLAQHYGADPNKARWIGLLHDCAKEYSATKKQALCEKWNIPLDPIIAGHIDLSHGLLGAKCAAENYFVQDPEILQGIRYHISGHGQMTLLDKIAVLADAIEPYREDYPPLKKMRELAYVDINKALAYGLRVLYDIDVAKGKIMHPWALDALNQLERGI